MNILTLDGITKTYGSSTVVDDLNLELKRGEFISLLGPSGCGKTTTLRMIAGFITPASGTIVMNDRVLFGPGKCLPPEKRKMSMIFQSYALWPNMTVEENVGFGLRMRKVSGTEAKRRVAEMLDVVQLGALAKRSPSELSGGQQQRVALARALVVKPDLVLLDEPLSNLDANLREEMRREIRRLHDEFGTTSIYVTHDQSEAMTSSDRIAVMNKGKIEQIDGPEQIYAHPATRYVAEFIGRSNILHGTVDRDGISFGSFDVPLSGIRPPHASDKRAVYAIRAQNLRLHAAKPPVGDAQVWIHGRIVERAFHGETWEYTFQDEHGRNRLRVSAPSVQSIPLMERSWLALDPAALVPVVE